MRCKPGLRRQWKRQRIYNELHLQQDRDSSYASLRWTFLCDTHYIEHNIGGREYAAHAQLWCKCYETSLVGALSPTCIITDWAFLSYKLTQKNDSHAQPISLLFSVSRNVPIFIFFNSSPKQNQLQLFFGRWSLQKLASRAFTCHLIMPPETCNHFTLWHKKVILTTILIHVSVHL